MHNPIKSLIESRVSTNYYDSDRQLSDEQIEELVQLATRAPTAYNFQNWKFIAVRSPEAKQRLAAASFGQRKVVDAAVTFIICGTLAAHEQLPSVLLPSVSAGIITPSTFDTWIGMAQRSHIDNPVLQRDEAIRSASLAAMTLILAAQGMGLATCAMSGFDAEALKRDFTLAANDLPVIMVTVGYTAETGNWPQKPRRAVREVMELA
ncbi:nitroreductase family protein [Chitinimonas arctica]|uniref:Nitroreductase family protein n=1 Tax=Chitinimonas arctica TaxID=2594795 RepID=A0A516SIQ3_9NEIS|nr:nitroreductase family protein [Chitinimonas arctica]QDQ27918.1 nitroreductase family protein [Chitinimonas arctica]